MSLEGKRAWLKLLVLLAMLLALAGIALFVQGTEGWGAAAQAWLLHLRADGGRVDPPWVVLAVVLASIVAVPLGAIIAVDALVFGPWLGAVYTLIGAALGASISYGLGRHLGHEALCRFAGERVNRFSQRLARRGVLAIVFIRLVPVAPFAIANMVAGMTHVRLRDFVLGTVLGMLPGLALIGFSVDWLLLRLGGA